MKFELPPRLPDQPIRRPKLPPPAPARPNPRTVSPIEPIKIESSRPEDEPAFLPPESPSQPTSVSSQPEKPNNTIRRAILLICACGLLVTGLLLLRSPSKLPHATSAPTKTVSPAPTQQEPSYSLSPSNVTQDTTFLPQVLPQPTATPSQAAESSPAIQPTPNAFGELAPSLRTDALATPQATYRVEGVAPGDFLNMRKGPAISYPIVQRLQAGVDGITLVGDPETNGGTTWQKINSRGVVGWVNTDYLVAAGSLRSDASSPSAPPIPYSKNSAQAFPAAATAPRTLTVSWDGRLYRIKAHGGPAIQAKIRMAEQYMARYVALRGKQSELKSRLNKSGPFGQKRLTRQIAETSATMKRIEREGDAVIADLQRLLKELEVR